MRPSVSALRRAAIVLVAACSVVCALFLVWQLVTREQVGMLSNGHLLGMLALCLLPMGTFAAWELDRRAAARSSEVEETGGFARHEERAREDAARSLRHRHHTGRRDRAASGL